MDSFHIFVTPPLRSFEAGGWFGVAGVSFTWWAEPKDFQGFLPDFECVLGCGWVVIPLGRGCVGGFEGGKGH